MTNTGRLLPTLVDSEFFASVPRLEQVWVLIGPSGAVRETVRVIVRSSAYPGQALARVERLMAGAGWVELASADPSRWNEAVRNKRTDAAREETARTVAAELVGRANVILSVLL